MCGALSAAPCPVPAGAHVVNRAQLRPPLVFLAQNKMLDPKPAAVLFPTTAILVQQVSCWQEQCKVHRLSLKETC